MLLRWDTPALEAPDRTSCILCESPVPPEVAHRLNGAFCSDQHMWLVPVFDGHLFGGTDNAMDSVLSGMRSIQAWWHYVNAVA
jgi:hypothetical protein